MLLTFTPNKTGSWLKRCAILIAIVSIWANVAKAQTLELNEDFATVPPTGWTITNLSAPAGLTTWMQGSTVVFNAYDGAATAFAAANYNATSGTGTISDWFISPAITIKNGDVFSFYTRTETGSTFPDGMEARMSTNGASTNVGASSASVGDFTTLLVAINPTLATGGYPETWTQYTVTISGVAGTVTGRIAFRYYVTNGGPAGANSDYIGLDRVVYNSIATAACTGVPAPGNTVSTIATGCPGTPFTLTPQNATPGTGVTYQWQSSPTGAAGSFTNIAGATSSSYSSTVSASTYYQVQVTCGGNTGTSTPTQVALTPPSGCYCTPPTTNCGAGDEISNVTVPGINNTTACSANGYGNYLALGPGVLLQGASNPASVTVTNGGTEYVGRWIDYNQNGQFEASEFTAVGTGAGGTFTTPIVVPATALLGNTRMRIRVKYNAAITGAEQCSSYTYGETEDYTVNIQPCVPVTITSQPSNASVVCGNNAVFQVLTSGSLPTYSWEYRTSSSGIWQTVPNAAPYSGVNTDSLVVAATGAQNGYQYRAIVTGACSAADFSNPVTLTVTPITLAITPATITKCASAAPVLISVPSTQFTATSTNNTAVAVPDNTAAGAISTNTISGVPAGANITQIDVKFTMAHTYCGDMIFNLKAPNGQILALDKYLTGTGNQAGTYPNIGFVNTVVSSIGTTAFSTAASQPITGTFRADMINAPIVGPTVQNPTGYVSNATSWAQLASSTQSPNGLWTLAMADGGAGDTGTLNSWTITITYGGAPATAVFTPTTGLYSNAAGTTPYAGGSVTQVYANPTANTTYSAVISAGACAGNPQTIQVNVNNAVGGTATLSNATICANKNTSFALGGTLSGGPAYTHNFQVSTNNGVTFTNITNGGVYGGANTNTLTLTNVPYSSNGYQFRDSINTPGGCGSLISNAATLTVNPTPVVTISAAPITNIYPGLTSTLTAAVSSATAPITYQWFRNGSPVAGATSNMLTVGVDGEGKYTVQVTDANGCTAAAGTSTPSSITIGDSVNTAILFIYPSPNSGQFQVRYYNDLNNGGTAPAIVNVYDEKGSRVFTQNYVNGAGYQSMPVDLGTHGKGLYRVELLDLNGNRIKTGSVMVF